MKFLEFWKTRGLFGILVENLKNHCVFLEFAMKFQKNLVFFDVMGSNSKKTSSFPKFQKNYQLAQIFLEFWKTRGFLEFWKIPKKPKVVLKIW